MVVCVHGREESNDAANAAKAYSHRREPVGKVNSIKKTALAVTECSRKPFSAAANAALCLNFTSFHRLTPVAICFCRIRGIITPHPRSLP